MGRAVSRARESGGLAETARRLLRGAGLVATLFARSRLPLEGARVEAYGLCRECRPRGGGGRGSRAG